MKHLFIQKFIEWLIGGHLFKQIQNFVRDVNDEKMIGEHKRDWVLKQVKTMFQDTATVLINIGIEVAVMLLKDKLTKPP